MDTYAEAHVYMLQTHAEHYQFEIALVTHRRRAPPDSHLLSSSISPSPSPTLFADFNNDIHPTQLGSDHSGNCLKPVSPWSMHMLEKSVMTWSCGQKVLIHVANMHTCDQE